MRRHRRGRRLLVPPALVVALALATSACGGSSGGGAEVASADGSGGATAENASTEEKVDPEQAGLDFARCMREHGVDMPDPKSGGDGFIMVGPGGAAGASASASASGEVQAGRAPEGFAEANEACRHHLEALIQDGGPPMDAEAQDKALKFARCMREHGIDMPDPDFSGGGAGLRIHIGADGIDPGSQTFQDAQKACGSLFGPDGPVPGRVGAATRGTSS